MKKQKLDMNSRMIIAVIGVCALALMGVVISSIVSGSSYSTEQRSKAYATLPPKQTKAPAPVPTHSSGNKTR